MVDIIIGYVGLGIALISLAIVFWDHFKDDRLLSKKVQEFYEDLEWLIYSDYMMNNFQNLFDENNIINEEFEKEYYNYELKNVYYRCKVK